MVTLLLPGSLPLLLHSHLVRWVCDWQVSGSAALTEKLACVR